jgi:hypothetical protein
MPETRPAAILGVIPPQVQEVRIHERWPSVSAYGGGAPARLGAQLQSRASGLIRMVVHQPLLIGIVLMIVLLPVAFALAALAWVLMAPFYFLKIMPFTATRYTVTNRRVMIQKGLKPKPVQEVALTAISDVRPVAGTEHPFFLAADVEILSDGKQALLFKGVKEYEQFVQIVKDAYLAWGRLNPPKEQVQSAAEMLANAKAKK